MTIRTFTTVAAIIFTLVALLHAARLLTGLPLIIGTWPAPTWLSAVGLAIAAYLAYQGFRVGR